MSRIKKCCRAAAIILGVILLLGAFGGYESGNYDFLQMIVRLATDSLIVLLLMFVGS